MSESVSCALCGSNDNKIVFNKAGQKRGNAREAINVICQRCGLVYNDPMPTDEDLKNFYSGHLVENKNMDEEYNKLVGRLSKIDEEKFQKISNFLRPHIEKIDRTSEVVDIGCGSGALLWKIKKDCGLRTVGIEPDKLKSRVAKEHFKIDEVRNEFFEEFVNQTERKFDMVSLRHVLEHLKDPNGVLSSLKGILKKDGYLFIVVPNVSDFKPSKSLEDSFEYGHVYSYTPRTLQLLLLKNGYKIVKWSFDYKLSLQILAVRTENNINSISFDELSSGCSLRDVEKALKKHQLRHILFRLKRKITGRSGI